jgi:hypothetical protein
MVYLFGIQGIFVLFVQTLKALQTGTNWLCLSLRFSNAEIRKISQDMGDSVVWWLNHEYL